MMHKHSSEEQKRRYTGKRIFHHGSLRKKERKEEIPVSFSFFLFSLMQGDLL